MSTKKTTLNPGFKTGLIILGIILAALLTWHSSSFLISSIHFSFGSIAEVVKSDLFRISEFANNVDFFHDIVQSIRK